MTDLSSGLSSYLDRIAEKSQNGEISWTQPNPSVFQWIRSTEDGELRVTIQKAEFPRSAIRSLGEVSRANAGTTYLFQVQNRRSRQPSLSLSSKERPDVFQSLEKIYKSAERDMDLQATQVLRQLLDDE